MDRTTHAEAVTAIFHSIPEINAEAVRPPVDFLARAGVLLADQRPVWGSMRSEAGEITEAVIYTETRVIHAIRHGREEQLVVRAFRRTDLSSLSIGASEAGWANDWDTVWTNSARIEATYQGGTVLSLPMSSSPIDRELRRRFDAFLPTLIADLDRPSTNAGL